MPVERPWATVVVCGPDGDQVGSWPLGPATGAAPSGSPRRGDGPDLATVHALARLQLRARRQGGRIVLRQVRPELADLLELAGLLGEMQGKPERREDATDVEERVVPGDPVT